MQHHGFLKEQGVALEVVLLGSKRATNIALQGGASFYTGPPAIPNVLLRRSSMFRTPALGCTISAQGGGVVGRKCSFSHYFVA